MPIYLDHHATTPLDPRVLEAMLPYLRGKFGNASSRSHAYGWEAEEAVERARGQVAALLGADPREILFTSGATESNNLAIRGLAERGRARGNRILISPIEHPSVADCAAHLATRGFVVDTLPVDGNGRVDPAAVEAALDARTILVSVMAANNEVGTIEPIGEIARLAAARDIAFHTDATQAVGKVEFLVQGSGVFTASLTGHKMSGPKGLGALYVRRTTPETLLPALLFGGGQERGIRPGTLNVPSIVGLGAACEICCLERETEAVRVRALRDRLFDRLTGELPGVMLTGSLEGRLSGNLHVSFEGIESQDLMLAVPELALSSGSACASGALEPSRVLKAMGVPLARARAAIRFGLGRTTTAEEVERAADLIVAAVPRLRRKPGASRRVR